MEGFGDNASSLTARAAPASGTEQSFVRVCVLVLLLLDFSKAESRKGIHLSE